MIPAQLREAMCCQITGWEEGRKWDMGAWGPSPQLMTLDKTNGLLLSHLSQVVPTLGGLGAVQLCQGRAVPRRGAGCSPLIPPLRGRRQLALFAGGFAHSSSWVTRLRNLSGDRGSWEP